MGSLWVPSYPDWLIVWALRQAGYGMDVVEWPVCLVVNPVANYDCGVIYLWVFDVWSGFMLEDSSDLEIWFDACLCPSPLGLNCF